MKKTFSTILLLIIAVGLSAQQKKNKELKFYLSSDSTLYVKGTGLAQIWVRYNENNPGSTVYGTPKSSSFDVGIRRARYQVMGQISPKVFLYTQIGINSFNYLSQRKTSIFFHDVTADYSIGKFLSLGAGLHGWNGISRYSSSATSSILCLDLPVVQETTNDVTDQFVRKLGVYAKGDIGRLNYRVSVSNPFPVQNALSPVAAMSVADTNIAFYATTAPELQYNGYFMFQMFDKESTQLPYMNGSYLGKKRVLNIGAGFAYQENAMWYRKYSGDTAKVPMQQFGVDVFYDSYIDKEKQNAITFYLAYLNYNFGPDYIRNTGPMNMANGVNSSGSFNGAGNSMPLNGTGQVICNTGGYLFRKGLLGKNGTLQPFYNVTYAMYERLKDPLLTYGLGFNWLLDGNSSKISVEYQDRPIYTLNKNNQPEQSTRRGAVIVQYQVSF
jgi:hypothetical protein